MGSLRDKVRKLARRQTDYFQILTAAKKKRIRWKKMQVLHAGDSKPVKAAVFYHWAIHKARSGKGFELMHAPTGVHVAQAKTLKGVKAFAKSIFLEDGRLPRLKSRKALEKRKKMIRAKAKETDGIKVKRWMSKSKPAKVLKGKKKKPVIQINHYEDYSTGGMFFKFNRKTKSGGSSIATLRQTEGDKWEIAGNVKGGKVVPLPGWKLEYVLKDTPVRKALARLKMRGVPWKSAKFERGFSKGDLTDKWSTEAAPILEIGASFSRTTGEPYFNFSRRTKTPWTGNTFAMIRYRDDRWEVVRIKRSGLAKGKPAPLPNWQPKDIFDDRKARAALKKIPLRGIPWKTGQFVRNFDRGWLEKGSGAKKAEIQAKEMLEASSLHKYNAFDFPADFVREAVPNLGSYMAYAADPMSNFIILVGGPKKDTPVQTWRWDKQADEYVKSWSVSINEMSEDRVQALIDRAENTNKRPPVVGHGAMPKEEFDAYIKRLRSRLKEFDKIGNTNVDLPPLTFSYGDLYTHYAQLDPNNDQLNLVYYTAEANAAGEILSEGYETNKHDLSKLREKAAGDYEAAARSVVRIAKNWIADGTKVEYVRKAARRMAKMKGGVQEATAVNYRSLNTKYKEWLREEKGISVEPEREWKKRQEIPLVLLDGSTKEIKATTFGVFAVHKSTKRSGEWDVTHIPSSNIVNIHRFKRKRDAMAWLKGFLDREPGAAMATSQQELIDEYGQELLATLKDRSTWDYSRPTKKKGPQPEDRELRETEYRPKLDKRRTIDIPLRDGRAAEVKAATWGVFAVHKSLNVKSKWVVTHIPSGYVLIQTRTKKEGVAVLRALAQEVPEALMEENEDTLMYDMNNEIVPLIKNPERWDYGDKKPPKRKRKKPVAVRRGEIKRALMRNGLRNQGTRYGKSGEMYGRPGSALQIAVGRDYVMANHLQVRGQDTHWGLVRDYLISKLSDEDVAQLATWAINGEPMRSVRKRARKTGYAAGRSTEQLPKSK